MNINHTFDAGIRLFSGEIAFKVFCKVSRKKIAGRRNAGIRKRKIRIHSEPAGIANNKFITVNFSVN
jgi:hypothetical protein